MNHPPRKASWLLAAVLAFACAGGSPGSEARPGTDDGAGNVPVTLPLPQPAFHHIHVNSVDPERALDWWSTFWPAGERTTVAGMPAFAADGIYLLYTEVETQAPGAFDAERRQSIPQSPFWTTGPSTDGLALYMGQLRRPIANVRSNSSRPTEPAHLPLRAPRRWIDGGGYSPRVPVMPNT